MTTSSFSEGIRKEIVLPEDDEDTFGRVVEHLYGNDDVAFDVCDLSETESADKLADMYALAEKYGLTDLKVRIIEEFRQSELLCKSAIAFFETARQIWQNTAESDQIFQAYFAEQALIHLKNLPKEDIEELSEMVGSGGSFARKLVQLQGELYHEELTLAKKQLQSNKAGAEARLASTEATLANSEAGLADAGACLGSTEAGLANAEACLASTEAHLKSTEARLASTEKRLASTQSLSGTTGGYWGYGGYGHREMEGAGTTQQSVWW